MMSKLEKYPKYKDSGIEWLGKIPEEWEALPIKRFHAITKETNAKRTCNNVLSLTLRGVVNNNIDSPEGLVPKDYATYQIFEKDNLVFKLIDLENISTSRVGIVHEKGIMSSAYIRLKVGHNSFPKYAYYYFYNLYLNQVYNNLGSGVRSTLGPTDLLNILYIEPPKQEQTKIANYLDQKTAQIDKAISLKEQMIERLKERRQILINDAVTKGLDKTVKMKDSGVEWIGEIPEHWEVKKLKYNLQLQNKKSRIDNKLVVALENIESFTGKYIKTNSKYDGEDNIFQKNDILFGKLRPYLSKVYLCEDEGIAFGDLLTYRPKNNFDSKFAFYLLISVQFIKTVDSSTYGSKMPRASSGFINEMLIPTPPKEEQIKIADYIEQNSQRTDKTIDLLQKQIEKLKEYKATLIDSVVTGKVRIA